MSTKRSHKAPKRAQKKAPSKPRTMGEVLAETMGDAEPKLDGSIDELKASLGLANGAPKPAETPAPAAQPFDEAKAIEALRALPWMDFDGTPNTAAPLMTLVGSMFDGYDVEGVDDGPVGFLARVLRSIADDIEMLAAPNDVLDHTPARNRMLIRIEHRARMAVELARRMERGEVQS